jgi:hypothetical protein
MAKNRHKAYKLIILIVDVGEETPKNKFKEMGTCDEMMFLIPKRGYVRPFYLVNSPLTGYLCDLLGNTLLSIKV